MPSTDEPLLSGDEVARLRDDARRWMRRADRLVAAFSDRDDPLPAVRRHLEALRHRRETLATKLEAFEHHRRRGAARGARQLEDALIDLREAWRISIRSLDRAAVL